MSGILKGIGKAFKSVVKVVKKVAPYALAIGAVVLTGGAAIGALPAVSTMVGSLGLSAGVSAALTSAVTSAGIGGALGLATGGTKGLKSGALLGAVTGGVLGAAGAGLDVGTKALDTAGLASATSSSLGAASTALGGAAPIGSVAGGVSTGLLAAGGAVPLAVPAASVAGAIPATAVTSGAGTSALGSAAKGLLGSPIVANAITGLGTGISNASAAKTQAASELALQDKKRADIAANYGTTGSGLLSNAGGATAPTSASVTGAFNYGGSYQYDPTLGRIVFVKATA